jgi:hypothetical protein
MVKNSEKKITALGGKGTKEKEVSARHTNNSTALRGKGSGGECWVD